MDYLREARYSIERAQVAKGNATAQTDAQLAIACALVALVERLDGLTVSLVRGDKALQTFTYTQEN